MKKRRKGTGSAIRLVAMACGFLIPFFLCAQTAFSQKPIVLDGPKFKEVFINENATAAHTSISASIDDIAASRYEFHPMPKIDKSVVTSGIHWIKFDITNRSNASIEANLLHKASITYNISLYKINSDGAYSLVKKTGNKYAYGTREIEFRKPVIPLQISPGTHTFIIMVEHQGAKSLAFSIVNSSRLSQYLVRDSIWLFFVVGVLCFSIVTNTITYFQLKYTYYLHYIMFCISTLALYSLSLGLTPLYLFPDVQGDNFFPFLNVLSVYASVIFMTLFSMSFLNSANVIPRFHRVLKLSLYAYGILSLFACYEYLVVDDLGISGIFCISAGLLPVPFMFVCGLRSYFRGYRPAYYFIISFGTGSAFIFVMCLIGIGAIEWVETADTWGLLSGAAQACLLSLAIGNRVKLETEHLHSELEKTIEHLDDLVDEKTAKIKFILNHVNIGIFKLNSNNQIDAEHSRSCLSIFSRDTIEGLSIESLLFEGLDKGPTEKEKIGLSTVDMALGEAEIYFEANAHCLPINWQLPRSKKHLELEWKPIINAHSEIIEGFLVTAKDVTYVRQLEEKSLEALEEVEFLVNVVKHGRERFTDYIASVLELIRKTRKLSMALVSGEETLFGNNMSICLRNLHTIKGDARTYGLDNASALIHACESNIKTIDTVAGISTTINNTLNQVDVIFHKSLEIIENKLPVSSRARQSSEAVVGYIGSLQQISFDLPEPKRKIVDEITNHLREEAATSLIKIVEPIKADLARISNMCGKATPELVIRTPFIYLKEDVEYRFRSILNHLVRNAVDHGIEDPGIRVANGKPANGTIIISAAHEATSCTIIFEDDGRGLAVRRIRQRGIAKGLIQPEDRISLFDLANLIFLPGFSSKDVVTEVSGRGVGMEAVKEGIQELGGSIQLEFLDPEIPRLPFESIKTEFVPFRLVLRLPATIFI